VIKSSIFSWLFDMFCD